MSTLLTKMLTKWQLFCTLQLCFLELTDHKGNNTRDRRRGQGAALELIAKAEGMAILGSIHGAVGKHVSASMILKVLCHCIYLIKCAKLINLERSAC